MSYNNQMLKLYDEFQAITKKRRATTREMAVWAIQTGKWQRHEEAAIKVCAEDFARALRERYETDSSGRRVRANHAAPVKQRGGKLVMMWTHMKDAGREFMEAAFRQRRNQVVGDCYQLKQDADSYNEFYNDGNPIQVPLDFTPDVEELEEMAKMKKDAA